MYEHKKLNLLGTHKILTHQYAALWIAVLFYVHTVTQYSNMYAHMTACKYVHMYVYINVHVFLHLPSGDSFHRAGFLMNQQLHPANTTFILVPQQT